MNIKPIYYDGSLLKLTTNEDSKNDEAYKVTDEVRKNLSGNPYFITK